MRVLTIEQIAERTGFSFEDGASRWQLIGDVYYKLINGTLFKRECGRWDEYARVFEFQSDDFQKNYMKKIDDALLLLDTCKKFKWEMCSAMEDATLLAFGYHAYHAIYADSRTKHEVVSLHAGLVERIEEHRNAFYKVTGIPEYTIQCKLGKTYTKQFKSDDECRMWIENHLDLSMGWSFSKSA